MRTYARASSVNIIYGTIRLIEQDRESFLPWARKPYACVVFNLHIEHNSAGLIRAGDQFRRLIDLGLRHGGSYFPTYHRHALRRQVDACFPQLPRLPAAQEEVRQGRALPERLVPALQEDVQPLTLAEPVTLLTDYVLAARLPFFLRSS